MSDYEKEQRYIKALQAEAAAVRALTATMGEYPINEELYEEQNRLYRDAVAERKEALKEVEA